MTSDCAQSPATISVILSTYNSPAYLKKALQALNQQLDQQFEVVVADDGSSAETRDLIAEQQREYGVPLIHAWHDDQGFRAAAARNNAVRLCRGDYLVFLDGDCLARPSFIAAHRQYAERGYFVRGSRIMLREALTRQIFDGRAMPAGFIEWIKTRVDGQVKRIGSLLPLPFTAYRKREDWQGVKTCNLGVWRCDFEAVNGFNEHYVGWGHEDADLAVRLLRFGARRKEGRAAIPVIHLWHQENDRGQLSDNVARLNDVLSADNYWVDAGLNSSEKKPVNHNGVDT